jgi:hypothetical protein
MGCCQSRLEAVSRCKARRRYTKQLVQARRDMAAAHALYLRALRATGASLLHFASAEADNPHPHSSAAHHHHQPPPPTPPPPPPPLSPTRTTTSWTTNSSSISASAILPPPPPPPMPSSWDFWDPFAPSSSRSATENADWDDAATTVVDAPNAASVVVTAAAAVAALPSIFTATTTSTTPSELTVVAVPRGAAGKKDLAEIATELDEYFLKAAEAGARVTALLECPICEPPETTNNNSNSFPGTSQLLDRLFDFANITLIFLNNSFIAFDGV